MSEAEIRQLRAAYYGLMSEVDDHLAVELDGLAKWGVGHLLLEASERAAEEREVAGAAATTYLELLATVGTAVEELQQRLATMHGPWVPEVLPAVQQQTEAIDAARA